MMQTLISEVGHRATLANAKLNQTTRTLMNIYGYTRGSFRGFYVMGFTI